ncbi:Regulator of G-protein signaling 9-binding protein [Trichinella spiralis]|uniref:Regulator of G-protein signaling 9-binding protein n=5 Tax=Trichinella TaxID=6333 RepID=A0ABR3KRX1_TRISP
MLQPVDVNDGQAVLKTSEKTKDYGIIKWFTSRKRKNCSIKKSAIEVLKLEDVEEEGLNDDGPRSATPTDANQERPTPVAEPNLLHTTHRRQRLRVGSAFTTPTLAATPAGAHPVRGPAGRFSLIAQGHRESVVSAFGRNTLIARDVLFGHLTRSSFLRSGRTVAESAVKLVHEINHMVASYKNMVQSVGTHSDSVHLREDLQHLKEQCLRTCDSAKNCILPQLKSETREPCHSSEFTKHANQFIGSVNLFIIEMRRCKSLCSRFVISLDSHAATTAPESSTNASSTIPADVSRCSNDSYQNCSSVEMEKFSRDLAEAEAILETLENAITIHFSTSKTDPDKHVVNTKSRRRSWRIGKLFANFKTSYA